MPEAAKSFTMQRQATEANGHASPLAAQLNTLSHEQAHRGKAQNRLEDRLDVLREASVEGSAALVHLKAQFDALAPFCDDATAEIAELRQELAKARTSLKEGKASNDELKARLVDLEVEAAEEKQRADALQKDLKRTRQWLDKHRREAERQEVELKVLQDQAERDAASIRRLTSERDALETQAARAAQDRRCLEQRRARASAAKALHEFASQLRKLEKERYKQALSGPILAPLRSLAARKIEAARRWDEETIAASGLFDQAWYLERHPDAAPNPIRHYLRVGALLGTDPCPLFDTDWYLVRNRAARRKGVNPLVHYITEGWKNNRSPHPHFDVKRYLEQNPEIAEAGEEPLAHYLARSRAEDRQQKLSPGVQANTPRAHVTPDAPALGRSSRKSDRKGQAAATAFHDKEILTFARYRDFQACIDAFQSKYDPSVTQMLDQVQPDVLRAYLRSLARCGRAEAAVQIAERLTRDHPGCPTHWSVLGFLQNEKSPANSRAYLQIALALGSTNIADILLTLRTHQLEGSIPHDLPNLIARFTNDGQQSRRIKEELLFARATIRAAFGDADGQLAAINEYFARRGLPPLALKVNDKGVQMDNFDVKTASLATAGPLVTVLMTTCNSEQFLETAIQSVLKQSYRNLELIVTDDRSNDGTPRILADWAEKDPRVQFIANRENVGPYASKNLGLMRAKGELITCHDSDDWSHPEKIARQVALLTARKDAAASSSLWVRLGEDGQPMVMRWGRMLYANPSSLMYRRDVVNSIGYYDSVRVAADTEFERRILARFGKKAIAERSDCLAFGRLHSSSLTQASLFGFDGYGASPLRQDYWRASRLWHQSARERDPEALYTAFPPSAVRAFPAPREILVDVASIARNLAKATGLNH